MARTATSYRCSSCGAASAQWYGRCPKCGEFSTLVEQLPPRGQAARRGSTPAGAPAIPARPVSEIAARPAQARLATGIGEFDRVLGGGLVAGQVCLCSGPPGSGKSTLLLAVADAVARTSGRPVLYVSGEESVEQIAVRARRIGALDENLLLAGDTDLGSILAHLDVHAELALLVVDSVQTVASGEIEGRAGGVTQTMAVAQALTRVAKERGLPTLLVGQVTKDSTVAGPRALEHIVDTTLNLEGDPHTSLRLLRAVKNRFGALEVAAFEQTDEGMQQVLDPSLLFREQREAAVPGTCSTVTVDGHRAIVAEMQSLVSPTTIPTPRRGVSGLDSARAAMLIAVSERASTLRLFDKDVFLATAAGMRVSDPGTDLAVCLALVSAARSHVVPLDMVAIGEVTLSGDVRPVPHLSERVAEAARIGFRRLVVPAGTRSRVGRKAGDVHLVEVGSLAEALRVLREPGERATRAPVLHAVHTDN